MLQILRSWSPVLFKVLRSKAFGWCRLTIILTQTPFGSFPPSPTFLHPSAISQDFLSQEFSEQQKSQLKPAWVKENLRAELLEKVHWFYSGAQMMSLWIWCFLRSAFPCEQLVQAGSSHAGTLIPLGLQPVLSAARTIKAASSGLLSIMLATITSKPLQFIVLAQ